ncbi:hypothetical protein OPV22_033084 [Ensete ventricosum]|uniref:Uncharacterized protein n=1 Tax=Ensete ventricosum TaxID=4639 RepID=A0AAV8Q069_ENSVE|nr:hypothetical protein OPV22_033084 [Ensete ventricosum]
MGSIRGSRSSAKMWDSAAMDARFSSLELRVSLGDVFRGWGSINGWLMNERCITFNKMQRQHDLGFETYWSFVLMT